MLDVETVPAADTVALVSSGARGGYSRPLLHRAVCATALSFVEDGVHGGIGGLRLETRHMEDGEEGRMLAAVDGALPDPARDDAFLVTFNGIAHDLPVLRARAMALWMFGLTRIAGWGAERDRHCDLMGAFSPRFGKQSSLVEVMALVGVDLSRLRSGQPATHWIAERDWRPIVVRNQGDVVATLLAYAYHSAWRRGCAVPVASAWVAIDRLAAAMGDRGAHLAPFRRHVLADVAAMAIADASGGAPCGCPAGRGTAS